MKVFKTCFLFFICFSSYSQTYSRGDSLRGKLNNSRNWWDVVFYNLHVTIDDNKLSIQGKNTIYFKTISNGTQFQVDLQKPLVVDSFIFHNKKLEVKHEYDAWTVNLDPILIDAQKDSVTVYYSGIPRKAKMAPWDGGFIWAKDKQNRKWINVACQGLGASVWWPLKDHQSDEPDNGMNISITANDSLVAISNGNLIKRVSNSNKTKTSTYSITNPINSYDVTLYLGNYVIVKDSFEGKNGKLKMEYVVLDYNKNKADSLLKPDTQKMLKSFEYWFGPYPFYADGFRLVESNFLGMEHQSAVAYGNKFRKGYMGMDRSGTGIGMLWDFIIIHECGHEWFGNNITTKDIADMWVHEGFTTYSEALFIESVWGKDSASKYVRGLRKSISNDGPIIGNYEVNKEGSGDMYDKGANMIHTIRQVINNDELFHEILLGLNKDFGKRTVTTKDVEDYISAESKINFKPVFDQYLRSSKIPKLEYTIKKKQLVYKWVNCNADFNMPVKVMINKGSELWIEPTTVEKKLKQNSKINTVDVDPNFYIRKN
ncbi:MAG: M1 family metallopeptidase [Sphingobacteriaceae bacterium]|nr:M1 family metallopeptidase [Sphingobacteriaceae bacterium]